MKYNYIKSVAIILLMLTGCTKNLDLIPKDSISDSTFWKNVSDYRSAANNLYLSLEEFAFWDTNSDIAFNVPNSISNGKYQTTISDANWDTPYLYIRRCNNIIEKASSSPIAGDVKRFVAEAKFFRAYNYWCLFRLYGEVPLILKVLDIDSEALYSPRSSRKEIVDFILKDLTEAAVDLPESKSLSASEKGRITMGAVIALKARVALFEGTWGKYRGDSNANGYLDIAIEASNKLINSSQYSLFTGKGAQSYRYLFIEPGDDAAECILDRRYQWKISDQNFSRSIQQTGYLPTKKLADMYLCTDGLSVSKSSLFQGYSSRISEFKNRDPRMTMTMMIPGTNAYAPLYDGLVENWPFIPQRNGNTGYILYKFMSEDTEVLLPGYPTSFDHHIIRYAEVLLIYAEALIEKNGSISDADLDKSINVIRRRVNMPPLTNVFVTANVLDMKQEIRRERTIELAMEGFRYDDLRRWKTAETEMKEDIKGIKIVGSNWVDPTIVNGANRNPYANASWQSKTDANGFIIAETGRNFDPSKHYLMPLPMKEILLNPKLKQNPNW